MGTENVFEGPVTVMQHLQWKTAKQLEGHFRPFSATYAESQYLNLATDDEIVDFLEKTPLFDIEAHEWTHLVPLKRERDVRARIHQIVTAIISALGRSSAEATRVVCSTDYKGLPHVEARPVSYATSPAMVIKASGPSFHDPAATDGDEYAPGLSYTNIASCFDVHLEGILCRDDDYYAQESAVFARQIFIQQPNRRFVRNLLITEEVCHLYHFDRSGGQYTPPINIHEDPVTFIRLVLGLSAADENVLGLDSSIRWEVEQGQRVSGTITVTDVDRVDTVYRLNELEPVFRRYDIRGRGTIGWRATAPDGREVFIKDYWRPEDGVAEYEILRDVLGVDGAVQLRNYEVNEHRTGQIRANGSDGWSLDGFHSRTSTRIVTDAYGHSILSFTSQTELVAAIRDVIKAHQTLVNDRNVLHRDLSQTNILLGGKDAKVGCRGALIDFDMASRGPRPLEQATSDQKVGTLAFMSVTLLMSSTTRYQSAPHHDQLDDLESIYYILFDLMNSWEGVGLLVKERPQVVRFWDEEDDRYFCATAKQSHFLDPSEPDMSSISTYWLPAMRELIIGLYRVIRKLILSKRPMRNLNSDSRRMALQNLLATADDRYEEILSLFDKALVDLETQERFGDPSLVPISLVSAATPISSRFRVSPDGVEASLSIPSILSPARRSKRSASPDFEEAPVKTKRARFHPTQFSPPRTRAWVKAAAARAKETDDALASSTSNRTFPVTAADGTPATMQHPSRPRTRAAVKAALLQNGISQPPAPRKTPRVANPRLHHQVVTVTKTLPLNPPPARTKKAKVIKDTQSSKRAAPHPTSR